MLIKNYRNKKLSDSFYPAFTQFQHNCQHSQTDYTIFDIRCFNKKTFLNIRDSAISFFTRNKRNSVYDVLSANSLNIAAIYKKRREVELLFKQTNRNLRVKRFYGKRENAIKTQIWIAPIVHLLFLILKTQNRESDRTFFNFCARLSRPFSSTRI